MLSRSGWVAVDAYIARCPDLLDRDFELALRGSHELVMESFLQSRDGEHVVQWCSGTLDTRSCSRAAGGLLSHLENVRQHHPHLGFPRALVPLLLLRVLFLRRILMSMGRSYPAPCGYSREQLVFSHLQLQKELAATRRQRDDFAHRFEAREAGVVFFGLVWVRLPRRNLRPLSLCRSLVARPAWLLRPVAGATSRWAEWLWVPARLMFWFWSRRSPSWLLLFVRRRLSRIRRLLLKSRLLWLLRLVRE